MFKTLTLAVAAAAIIAAVPAIAQAKSIKDLLTDQQLSNYCAEKPVGGETTGAVTVGDHVITGSIHCEPENYLPVGQDGAFVSDDGLNGDDSDDDDGSDDDGEDDDSGDDHSGQGSDDSNDDGDDDNSGPGNSDDD